MGQLIQHPRLLRPTQAVAFREHLVFFDADRDGSITPQETRIGLERLGFGRLLSVPAAVLIHGGLVGLAKVQGSSLRPLKLDSHATGNVRHPDMKLVDEAGYFDEPRLQALFARYGYATRGASLRARELSQMLLDRFTHDVPRDLKGMLLASVGVSAAAVEWGALYWLAPAFQAGRPALELETVKRFYIDSEFFERVADQVRATRDRRSRTVRGTVRNWLQAWLV